MKKHQKIFGLSVLLTVCVMAACTVAPTSGTKEKAWDHWQHYDIDRNASVDKTEYQNLLKDAFAKLDADGDGVAHVKDLPVHIRRFDRDQDGKVAWAEYKSAATEAFAKADTDGNGSLSMQELASLDFLR